MTFYRLLLHSLRRSTSPIATAASISTIFSRSLAYSSPEEAKAALRKLKRDRRIQPPLYALRRDPSTPRPPPDPNAPRLPDSTSSLVGPRLNLHNRVQSLIRGGDLDAASVTARQAVFSRTRPTVFTCNAIIASMYRAGRYTDAVALFKFFFNQSNIVPNIVSYNNLINSYCDTSNVDTALEVYRYIIANAPFSPSPVTFRHLTKGLIDADRITDAMDLLREMLEKGHGADSLVYNNLIAGFLNLGNLEKANELFDELRGRCQVYDGVVNATFMNWFFKKGMDKEAMESYQGLLDCGYQMTPTTCNVLLDVLLKHGKSAEANTLFERMLNNHKPPNIQAVNSETYNIMVNECFRLGKISEALAVFRQSGTGQGAKPYQMDGAGYNNMIGKLCEHDMVAEADNLFQEMSTKQVIMDYNTYMFLIEAYFREERVDDVLQKLNKFVFESNLKANPSFFNTVFGWLLNKGKIEQVGDILGHMGDKDVKPDPSIYELVITVLCKEGNLDRTRGLLDQLVRYNVGVTSTLRTSLEEAFGKEAKIDELERLIGRPHQSREGAFARAPHQAREGAFARAQTSSMHQARDGSFAGAPASPMQGSEGNFPRAPPSFVHQAREGAFAGAPTSPTYQSMEGAVARTHQSTIHQAREGTFARAPPSPMHQVREGGFTGALASTTHQPIKGAFARAPPSTIHQAREGFFTGAPASPMQSKARYFCACAAISHAPSMGRVFCRCTGITHISSKERGFCMCTAISHAS